MVRVFDIECNFPLGATPSVPEERAEGPLMRGSGATFRGREREVVAGYGLANYANIFKRGEGGQRERPTMSLDEFADMLGRVGVERAIAGTANMPNGDAAHIARSRPDRFIGFARVSPWDGMLAVRELERLVREEGLVGMATAGLSELIPASDRRYYPLYAKCVELGIPARIYSTMNYGTDREYDLGHPRHLDQVCVDFPELTVIAGLGGWPWVNEMVALVRRHPNLYVDTAAHRPRHFKTPGSGWEMLLQFGNTLIQDKVMVGISWLTIGESYETLIGEYLDLPLRDSVKEKWLYGNAARVLGAE